ncbi:trypsin-like serine protease [Actinomadura graeca]|uniref:Trypsin-like serine protease n=1 Tax=Actinomadura graeca TaxID=2750812 RepID=A0ABX8R0E2_9ACTN|nr:trypsin-like serine protease [Actinomadura graeca]QXJ24539.1 trypsin-like serine protease [Actinomadura graeca]
MKIRKSWKTIAVALPAATLAAGALTASPASAITGGVPSSHVQGAVQIYQNGHYICGGALVAQNYILTAAHCLYEDDLPLPVNEFTVYVGDHRLGQGERHGIAGFVRHNVGTGSRPKYADIALARLTENVSQTNQIIERRAQVPPINANVALHGFGHLGDMKIATMRVNSTGNNGGTIGDVKDGLELKETTATSGRPDGGDSGSPVIYGGRLVAIHAEWEDDPGQEAAWAVEVPFHATWISDTLAGPPVVPDSGQAIGESGRDDPSPGGIGESGQADPAPGGVGESGQAGPGTGIGTSEQAPLSPGHAR